MFFLQLLLVRFDFLGGQFEIELFIFRLLWEFLFLGWLNSELIAQNIFLHFLLSRLHRLK